MNTPMGINPLLDFSGLPRFAEFRSELVTPAIDQLLADCRAAVARAEAADTPAEWDAFVAPLDDANEKLGRAWGQVSHLHSVMDSPELREVYNANLPKITVYYAELGQNEALFAKFKALDQGIEGTAELRRFSTPSVFPGGAPLAKPACASATRSHDRSLPRPQGRGGAARPPARRPLGRVGRRPLLPGLRER